MNMYIVELKRSLKSFLNWTIAVMLVLALFLAFFPSMASSGMAELVRAKISAIPESMRNALGISNMIDFSDLLQYFAYVLQFILIAGCMYSLIIGASSLIKEESEGTIEFLYAKPISRTKIVTIKLLSTLTTIILFNLLLYIVCIIYGEAYKKTGYDYITMLTNIFTAMFLAQLVFLFVGFVFSTVLRKYSQAIPFGLGVFFITYILGTFSTIIDKLSWLQYISPYHYAVPLTILKANGDIENIKVMLLMMIIIVSIAITYRRYKKKDLII